ncbi:hypothetical protein TFLX_06100 [Thermoflexales bacterium]|nr:hypothetical protein TFLX_06100 [Thermoflexales bacterium]
MDRNLADGLVIWSNGFLAISYWLWENAAVLLTIGLAVIILLRYDHEVRKVAGERTLRYGRGRTVMASHRTQYETLGTLLIWTMAAWLMAPPIPFIGLLMWTAFWAALRWIPQEREQILFRQKTMIAHNPKFSTFTSTDVLAAASACADVELNHWITWYQTLHNLS